MENKIITIDSIDYELVPLKKKETLEDYLKGHRASGLKVGDNVKVLREFEDFEGGCGVDWGNTMKYFIGNTYKIKEDFEKNGFGLWNGNETDFFYFPYFVLEKVEEPAKKEVKNYEDVVSILEPKWNYSTLFSQDGEAMKSDNIYLDSYPSKEKAEQSFARTQLYNVAHYLNETEFKDVEWDDTYNYLFINALSRIGVDYCSINSFSGKTRFKSERVARRAIEILGQETIKLALK